ncbi:hypothetical protein ES705_50200 [subsurface metagenome]
MPKKRRLKLSDMQTLANEKDGSCLSTEYINANSKLIWKCSVGHIWEATPSAIKTGTWCPKCLGRNTTIEDMQFIAA